jgi:methyltransferase
VSALKTPLFILALAFIPMIVEARRSRANERRLLAAGATEPAGDVYPIMLVAYPACFVGIALEAWVRHATLGGGLFVAGATVFTAGKLLKYWAIVTLGRRWTFRVLVPPQSARITSGPYRWMSHPNYIGVAGELVGAALMGRAPIAGFIAVAGFGALMLARVRVEARALDAAGA